MNCVFDRFSYYLKVVFFDSFLEESHDFGIFLINSLKK